MYFIVYKVTNKNNGKVYVGDHATKDINDNYLGSGVLISAAIQKHGRRAFIKEVLSIHENADDMFLHEASVVTSSFVSRSDTYNLIPGGCGGMNYGNKNEHTRSKMSEAQRARKPPTLETRLKMSEAQTIRNKNNPTTAETRAKISDGHKGKTKSFETRQRMKLAAARRWEDRKKMRKLILILITLFSLSQLGSAKEQTNKPIEVQSVQHGKASWYSVRSNGGTKTASGQKLTNHGATAAHKTLPLGTKVRVTNVDNGKEEIVTIIDRGPYIKGRVIDLTLGVAERLGFVKQGVVKVKVEVLAHNDT